jgi:hypothetical protein
MDVSGCHAPAALLPGKNPGTHCCGGWVGPRTGLNVSGDENFSYYRASISGLSSP